MPIERSDIEHPLWRKKVDSSLFEHLGTVIPGWLSKQWNIGQRFSTVTSKKSPLSNTAISFGGQTFPGSVTVQSRVRRNPLFRLWYPEELLDRLKHAFLMSYMRHLEGGLRAKPCAVQFKMKHFRTELC